MKQKVALVLSGGGARGIAHIGAIEELEKNGFQISSIAGTSMGAVVGGVYASGKLEAYKEWLYTLDKMKLFNLLDFSFTTEGLVKGDKLFHKMKEFISDQNIEDFGMPYAAVAADIINKKEVIFTEGNVFNAIRASVAIPTVLTPVKTADGLLVDGGVINNIPIEYITRTPGDILIAVNVNADIPYIKPVIQKTEIVAEQSVYQKRLKDFYHHLQKLNPLSNEEKIGYFNLINKTISLMMFHIAKVSIEQHPPDILIEVSADCCGAFDFYRAEEMVETGRAAAIQSLEKYNEGGIRKLAQG
ncbi:patatin-like phospholipase family protein [Mucilaginibacter sp. X4EP1]|uniref:patatin-like phospholipase family protein n=1 Tax=Mucilaginibacter sp. X4EP1 TaxID=2723092 RepID=UPI002169B410|nr:patatin-like phospholipase family protein [Mucilaginibacter sp. X4EP1]MCS3812443.1 NTE family protein [Mucilaginibacter sp. X4EP1]